MKRRIRVRPAICLMGFVAMLGLPVAQAQAGPDLVPVAFHPYPDESDILGFPAPPRGDIDHYMQAYRLYDENRDGFDFPHVVVDGTIPIEGLPDGSQPFASTKAAYADAIATRLTVESPLTLSVQSSLGADARIFVEATPRSPLTDETLSMRVVLMEDHVFFEAPPALSNGISNHRFTARNIASQSIDLSAGETVVWNPQFDISGYDAKQLYAAVWVQAGTESNRFAPLEVLQAALHPIGGDPTVQESKAVLLETYTASWCDACVYGDLAIEELAEEHGAGRPKPVASGPTYWQGFQNPGWTLAAGAVFVFAVTRMRGAP